MRDPAVIIQQQFLDRVKNADFANPTSLTDCTKAGLSKDAALSLFDSQIKSRLLDIVARELKEQGRGFYTIGSSGHEANAVFGQLFSYQDLAFLHYRSGAFFLERAKQMPEIDGVSDILLSLMAAKDDPISGGRHKVFGSLPLFIPPQTSTIASHLPKALGAALSITRAKELKIVSKLPWDSVILCSFGDASVNHASAQTTFNACGWLATQHYPLPLVFICEDNGIGISVPTPKNWIEQSIAYRPGIHYLVADGLNLADVYLKTKQAEQLARVHKKPVFLHVKCIRLLGHAGSDIELQYRDEQAIAAIEACDPLLHSARIIVEQKWLSPTDIEKLYLDNYAKIQQKAASLQNCLGLSNAQDIKSAIIPDSQHTELQIITREKRQQVFAESYPQLTLKRNLCQLINFALTDLMLQYPQILIFGEDVAKKGGVYRVTANLQSRFGQRRVFDTILDETTILGSAIGFTHNGFIPIPEIQFLAYLHNAEDQLRGEAATLSFFSNKQFTNPMVIRIAALGYQKGFGGHFHNDNSIAVLRDLPGVIVCCPSNGLDAVLMLRSALRMAHTEQRIVVFLEPIALYMTKDLHQAGDNLWLNVYPPLQNHVPFGEVNIIGQADTLIISYANGFYLSCQAQKILAEQHQKNVMVMDLRWLSPLPELAIINAAEKVQKILIVDECRKSGSLSEAIITLLIENLASPPVIKRLTGEDCFIPLGNAWQHLLPSRDSIIAAIIALDN